MGRLMYDRTIGPAGMLEALAVHAPATPAGGNEAFQRHLQDAQQLQQRIPQRPAERPTSEAAERSDQHQADTAPETTVARPANENQRPAASADAPPEEAAASSGDDESATDESTLESASPSLAEGATVVAITQPTADPITTPPAEQPGHTASGDERTAKLDATKQAQAAARQGRQHADPSSLPDAATKPTADAAEKPAVVGDQTLKSTIVPDDEPAAGATAATGAEQQVGSQVAAEAPLVVNAPAAPVAAGSQSAADRQGTPDATLSADAATSGADKSSATLRHRRETPAEPVEATQGLTQAAPKAADAALAPATEAPLAGALGKSDADSAGDASSIPAPDVAMPALAEDANHVAVNAPPLKGIAASIAGSATPRSVHGVEISEADRARFVQRVARALHSIGEDGGQLRLRLSPPELGSMRLEITVNQGVLAAHIEAETPHARQLLLDNLPALRERLQEQNIKVERFDVDVTGQSSGGWSQESARGRQQEQFQRRGNVRQPAAPQSDVAGPLGSVHRPMSGDEKLNVLI